MNGLAFFYRPLLLLSIPAPLVDLCVAQIESFRKNLNLGAVPDGVAEVLHLEDLMLLLYQASAVLGQIHVIVSKLLSIKLVFCFERAATGRNAASFLALWRMFDKLGRASNAKLDQSGRSPRT